MNVYDGTKIYIFCPDRLVTGGPEALHQLRYYLERAGYDAVLVYEFSGDRQCPERYREYAPRVVSYEDVADDEKNILIVPETGTAFLRLYHRMQKCIWFLSWGYYADAVAQSGAGKVFLKRCFNLFRRRRERKFRYPLKPAEITKEIVCCCGSRYAYLQVTQALGRKDAEMLVEPISLDFLRRGMADHLTSEGRGDVVLYNPAKPSAVMRELLARTDIAFFPLRGMTPDALIDRYRSSKLYIDFGEFGGPERIPKEAVYNGTCLLVGRRNAAENTFDVAIPERFKIADYTNSALIAERIKDLLSHYDEEIGQFAAFRTQIDGLEENFLRQIRHIFRRR